MDLVFKFCRLRLFCLLTFRIKILVFEVWYILKYLPYAKLKVYKLIRHILNFVDKLYNDLVCSI